MPKKNKKTKPAKPKKTEKAGDGFQNLGDPQKDWKEELAKQLGVPQLKIDFSRGPQHATVALQPGQTREELEKTLGGMSLEEYAASHMEMKKENRLWYARFGYVLYPGPNGIYDATFVTNGWITGSLAEKYKFDKLNQLFNNPLILRLRSDPEYINAEDCSWDDISIAMQFFLRWDEAEEKAYLAKGCKLSQIQVEKKTCKHLLELMAELSTRLSKLCGAGPDDKPTLPEDYDVYQNIWKDILDKIKVEATDYTERATKHFPEWAKETMRKNKNPKEKTAEKKTDNFEEEKDCEKKKRKIKKCMEKEFEKATQILKLFDPDNDPDVKMEKKRKMKKELEKDLEEATQIMKLFDLDNDSDISEKDLEEATQIMKLFNLDNDSDEEK